ncbi:MAG: glycosyltransferase family 4 protein [Candidatus Hydrogenedentes bacterium]|nr:glycosyltransferase family 4 protein [Candidatus Hydrogenedentota bacterium]
MRIALVDLLFSWPPHGGADVDLYNLASGLHRLGHDVQVVFVNDPHSWERGSIQTGALPFPVLGVSGARRDFTRKTLPRLIREAVDLWRPDVVFLGDGFLMKPYVGLALADYPLVARYYAYEMACLRDILHYKDGAPCPLHFLKDRDACRACALDHLKPDIRSGRPHAWAQEYLAARAYAPDYVSACRDYLKKLRAAIVYNETMRDLLSWYCETIHIIPGGVDVSQFRFEPPARKSPRDKKHILMTGRAEDPVKGYAVLAEAGERLWAHRRDFQIQVTLPEETPVPAFVSAVGWHAHGALPALYRQADICAVPSVWEEPFGMVAIEAMATGRPVCASRTGGLREIVSHMQTGFLFEPGDAGELAKQLEILLDNPELRLRMGIAAQDRVDEEYTWSQIILRKYYPVFEQVRRRG